jgi:hypothetical protein
LAETGGANQETLPLVLFNYLLQRHKDAAEPLEAETPLQAESP